LGYNEINIVDGKYSTQVDDCMKGIISDYKMLWKMRTQLAIAFRWLATNPSSWYDFFELAVNDNLSKKEYDLFMIEASRVINYTEFEALIQLAAVIWSSTNLVTVQYAKLFLKSNLLKGITQMMNWPKELQGGLFNLNNSLNKIINLRARTDFVDLISNTNELTYKMNKNLNKIFFGFSSFVHTLNSPQILNADLLLDAINKFWENLNWDDLKLFNKFSVQIKIKFMNGQYRSLTKYWAYYPNEIDVLFKDAHQYILDNNSKYDQDDQQIIAFIFSWKYLTDQEVILSTRSPSAITPVIKDWDQTKINVPSVWDFKQITDTIIRVNKYNPNAWFIENVLLQRDTGETLPALVEVLSSTGADILNASYREELVGDTLYSGNNLAMATKLDAIQISDTPKVDKPKSSYEIAISQKVNKILPKVIINNTTNIQTQFVRIFSQIGGLLLTEFLDVKNSVGNTFNRTFINGKTQTINENEIIQETGKIDPNQAFMKALPKATSKEVAAVRFAAWDMETRANDKLDINNKPIMDSSMKVQKILEPISISFYQKYRVLPTFATNMSSTKEIKETWFINDFKNTEYTDNNLTPSERMLKDFVIWVRNETLKSTKNLNLYAHNAAKFDMQFLLAVLIKNLEPTDSINIIQNKGKLVSVDLNINAKVEDKKTNKVKVSFLDSYQLLPGSLNQLAKQFGVDQKIVFDVKNIDQDTDLDAMEFRLLTYNMKDSIILFEILKKVSKMYLTKFNVNMFCAPTNSSLAMRIFRTNYLDQARDQINITSKEMYEMIKPAYMGGACDVYIPKNPDGSTISYYDINSLYPSMMAMNKLPTGKYYIIKDTDMNIFDPKFDASFIRAHVECPHNIKVPLLQQIVDGKTIAGAGSWNGVFYVAELREAVKLGYTIKPSEAIVFEARNVFDKFINEIYNMRLTFPKSDPMNWICKQTMNSSYGRFGMSPELSEIHILDKEGVNDFQSAKPIEDIKYFGDDKVMVTRTITRNESIDTENSNHNLQISLPLAAAVTSHSRIQIHRLKMEAAARGILLYSDTDSLVCSDTLPTELLGKGLGLLKLECTAEKGVFLAPKVYALTGVKDGDKQLPDILKAKGIKNMEGLTFDVYEKLLNTDEVFISHQPKWFRNIIDGNITIKNLRTLTRITSGKRQIVLNLNNMFVSTNNMIFDGAKVITPPIIKQGLPAVVGLPTTIETQLPTQQACKSVVLYEPTQNFQLIDEVIHLGAPESKEVVVYKPTLLISAPSLGLNSIIRLIGPVDYKWLDEPSVKWLLHKIQTQEVLSKIKPEIFKPLSIEEIKSELENLFKDKTLEELGLEDALPVYTKLPPAEHAALYQKIMDIIKNPNNPGIMKNAKEILRITKEAGFVKVIPRKVKESKGK